MSLRLRLTLIYTGLLSGVAILLSIVIYSIASVVIIGQVDDILQQAADQIVDALQVSSTESLEFTPDNLTLSPTVYFQIWSEDTQLLFSAENTGEINVPLDGDSLNREQPIYRDVVISQVDYRVLTVPLTSTGADFGQLQVGMEMTTVRNAQKLFQFVFGGSAVFAIIVSGFVIWLVTGQALSPLGELAQITNRITSTDDLSKRIPVDVGRNDEIAALVLTFNQTLVRLERLFNAQRRFLADVSHELRTPLTVIKGNVGLMRIMKNYDEESLLSIESEVDRLTRLVGDLLLMAQAESGRLPLMLEPVELDELLFEVFAQMKVLASENHVIRIGNIGPAVVMGDRDRLKQVLLNLGSNAINYSPEGGQIIMALHVRGNWVQVKISDEGVGIPKEELSRLFERFYRGDKSRTRSEKDVGFGLGLPIAYWIIRNHGGRIDVETEDDKGTTFTIWLPLSQSGIPTRPLSDKYSKKQSKKVKPSGEN